MRARRITWIAAAVTVATVTLLLAGPASAGPGAQLRIEPGWYQGHAISFLQPSLFSANPNGGIFACFGLGPDLSGINRPTAPLYVILHPTATQDHAAQVQAALAAGVLVDISSALSPTPDTMVAPVIGGS